MRYSRTRFNRDYRLNENRRRRSRLAGGVRRRFNEMRGPMSSEKYWSMAPKYMKYLQRELLKRIKGKKARDIYPYDWFWFLDLHGGEYNLNDMMLTWNVIVHEDLGHPDLETAARKFGFDPFDFIAAEEDYGIDLDDLH